MKDDFGGRITLRHWIAWQLVKIGNRLHPSEYSSHLRVHDPAGKLILELGITNDCWGGGLHSAHFPGDNRGFTVTDTAGMLFDKPPVSDHKVRVPSPESELEPYCECCWEDWPCPDALPERRTFEASVRLCPPYTHDCNEMHCTS